MSFDQNSDNPLDPEKALTVEGIQAEFDRCLEAESWLEMGWLFWYAFSLTAPDSVERNLAYKLWQSLTHDQQAMCDGLK